MRNVTKTGNKKSIFFHFESQSSSKFSNSSKMSQLLNIFIFNTVTGSYRTYSTFTSETNTSPIAADYIKCQGSENSMRECLHFSHSYSTCTHDHDVGIRCKPGK